MRVHPISLALRYLRGQRSFRGAPYLGKAPFESVEEAVAVLREFTGQDFGVDAARWGEWLRRNRRVYRWGMGAAGAREVVGHRPRSVEGREDGELLDYLLKYHTKKTADAPMPASWISRRRSSPEALRRRFGTMADGFLEAMRTGDEIRAFCNSKVAWAMRCGREGYVLLREGKVVKKMVTGMS